MSTNCILRLFHVLSANNLADQPSRSLSLADSRLSVSCWKRLQDAFGGPNGHSVDFMALPSNVMRYSTGVMLPFFSPHPSPGCSGVKVFSQSPDFHPPQLFSNPYVFPPICLIPNVLRFLSSFRVSFTIVVPDVRPRCFWWALLPHCSPSSLFLRVRARWVFCDHPPRVAIKISGLYLGIYGRFVSTLCKEAFRRFRSLEL